MVRPAVVGEGGWGTTEDHRPTKPTILESITALAMNFPRNLNLEQISSTLG